MPSYDYQCDACQAEFEIFQSIHDEALTECLDCRKPKLRRLISGAGVIFKGSGFYINDSKAGSSKENGSAEKTGNSAPATKTPG